jgi:hypothetical protein
MKTIQIILNALIATIKIIPDATFGPVTHHHHKFGVILKKKNASQKLFINHPKIC